MIPTINISTPPPYITHFIMFLLMLVSPILIARIPIAIKKGRFLAKKCTAGGIAPISTR
jgi:hypothetical protein